jgi:hypothetical protein
LKNDLRDFVEEIDEDQVEGSVILAEEIHFLKKQHNHIDEDQTAQAQAKYLQKLASDIAMERPVMIKHR